jgi:hypothetical protein
MSSHSAMQKLSSVSPALLPTFPTAPFATPALSDSQDLAAKETFSSYAMKEGLSIGAYSLGVHSGKEKRYRL